MVFHGTLKAIYYILIFFDKVLPTEYRSEINNRQEMLHILTIAAGQSIHAFIYSLK